jgi:hypothetical protein
VGLRASSHTINQALIEARAPYGEPTGVLLPRFHVVHRARVCPVSYSVAGACYAFYNSKAWTDLKPDRDKAHLRIDELRPLRQAVLSPPAISSSFPRQLDPIERSLISISSIYICAEKSQALVFHARSPDPLQALDRHVRTNPEGVSLHPRPSNYCPDK